jgi:hypothetical protein
MRNLLVTYKGHIEGVIKSTSIAADRVLSDGAGITFYQGSRPVAGYTREIFLRFEAQDDSIQETS